MRPTHQRDNSHHSHDSNANNANTPKHAVPNADGLRSRSKLSIRSNARLLAALIAIALIATGICLRAFRVEASSAPTGAANSAKIKWASPSFGAVIGNTRLKGPLASYFDILTTGVCSGTRNIPGDYATLALAITDISTNGVLAGGGGCTLNVIAGNPQTAPPGGYSLNYVANPSTAADQLFITGNGNTITAGVGVSTSTDAIFKLIGADYVTLQGFTMQESVANVTATTQVEWGVALLYASTTNGAQNNTIQNNSITLNKTNLNTWGIYSNTRHAAGTPATTADITNSTTGPNSGNKVYNNIISNVNMGIAFIGSGTAANQDIGNDIGGAAAGTGNTISNWGGAGATGTYISNSGTSYCIFMNHQVGENVSYNTITSATISGTSVTLRGIFKDYTTTGATIVGTTSITNNTLTITDNFTSGTLEHIRSQGTVPSTSTLNINNNTILNSSMGGAASSTTVIGIINSEAVGTLSMSNNIIRGTTSTATTGGFTGISNTGTIGTSININSNQIGNSTSGAITFSAATSGAVTGITNTGGAAAAPLSMNSNNIQGIVHAVTGSSTHTYITWTHGNSVTDTVNLNTFTNLNVNTTGSVNFLTRGTTSMSGAGVTNITNNSIVTAFNKGAAGNTVTFLNTGAGDTSPAGTTFNETGNNFSNITLTGATTVAGWSDLNGPSGGGVAKNITGNTFSNISTGSASVQIIAQNFGGNGTTVSNNTISNVTHVPTVTALTMTGISIGSSSGGATHTVANNAISGLSSTGTGGQNIGILGGATTITTFNISGNTVSGISSTSTAGPIVAGIFNQNTGTTVNIFKNKVFDIVCSPGAVMGINSTATAAANTINVSNNIVGRLYASTSGFFQAARGLLLQSTVAATFNVYFNTVYLDGTTPTQTYCVYIGGATANVPNVNAIDNIFVNNVTSSNGATLPNTVYFRLGTTTATNLAATTNNNLLYGGTPAVDHLIYVDGAVNALTNPQQTLASYQAFVTTRESASKTELPPFLNTTNGSLANYLHISSVATQVNNGGIPIIGFTTDYDGDTRDASTPDIGADEITTMQFSSATYTVAENVGGGVATITVTRNAGTGNAATVNYATSPGGGTTAGTGTCTAGDDYLTTSGTLSFLAGETSKTFDVTICNDAVFESDETVNLTLSAPTGSLLGTPNTAVLTITNDDAAPDITFNADGNLNAGTYNNITMNGPAIVTMTGNVVVNGCVFVNTGSTLLMGTFTFTGPGCYTLNSGGTLGVGSTAGITTGASGNVQVGGTRTFSTGASFIYNGSADQAVGNALPSTLANLTINNSGTPGTVTGNLGQTVTGFLAVVDGVYVSASDYNDVSIGVNGTLSLAADITVSGYWTNNGAFTHNGFPVTFDGVGMQTISGFGTTTFSTLIVNKASGDLTLDPSTPIAVAGASGNVLQLLGGGINLNDSSLTLTGAAGNILVDTGNHTVSNSGASAGFNLKNTIVNSTNSGTLTFGPNVFVSLNNPGDSVDFGPSVTTINGTLLLSNGGVVNNAPIYGVGSELRYNGGGSYPRGVEWSATSGAGYPYNVQVAAGQSLNLGSTSPGTALQMAGSLTITPPSDLSMDVAGSQMTAALTVLGDVNNDGELFLSSLVGGDLNVGGHWTNNGTFTANNGTVIFIGSSNQNVGGSSLNNFEGGLTMNGSGGVTLTADAEVSGLLTLTNGKITTGANVLSMGPGASGTGASSASYVIGNQKKNYFWPGPFTFDVGTPNGYSPVEANVSAGAGDLTVKATQGPQPLLNASTSLQRYWTLTKTGPPMTADLTFHYLDDATDVAGNEANYRLIIVEGGNATSFPESCPTVACVDESANTITRNGVTTFSDWTAAEPNAPTAVKLTGFAAVRKDDEVMLSWQSGYEARNLGYNVYREQDGKRVQITPSLVAGSALIAGRNTSLTAGLSYSWHDRVPGGSSRQSPVAGRQSPVAGRQSPVAGRQSPVAGQPSAVSYWLEDVDLDGTRTLHGPIAVSDCAKGDAACKQLSERSKLLGELTSQQTANSKQQTAGSNQQSAISSQQSGVEFSSWPADTEKPSVSNEVDPAEMQRTIAGMEGLKISVSRPGWYRISQPEVLAAGFNVADANGLQLYREGRQVPFSLSNANEQFGPSDYLEFYGEGISSTTARAATYYLVKLAEPGKRIPLMARAVTAGDRVSPQGFAYTVERKERLIYFSGLLNGAEENFFGQVVSGTTATATLPISNIDQTPQQPGMAAQLEVVLQGVSSQSHEVQVRFNGTTLGTMNYTGTGHPSQAFSLPAGLVHDGSNTVELTSLGGAADVSLLDAVRLTYTRQYEADNNELAFSLGSRQTKRLTGFSKNVRVVDITDPYDVLELTPLVLADGAGFAALIAADVETRAPFSRPHALLAFADGQVATVDGLTMNEPSSWWSETAGADYLIVTKQTLATSLEPLAQHRRNQGLVVKVVDVADIYDEFSFGNHSPQAVHDFLARATATWTRQPHYVLLAGDATYDPKNYTGQGLNDLVPTKLIDTALTETASDDWLADFNADGIADLALGRLPVRTTAQVDALVAKIIGYENATPDPTRAALLVADNSFEGQSSALQGLLPSGMTVQTINRSSADDATIHNQIITELNQGPLVANYVGHGSNGVWTGASLLSSDDAPNLTNTNRLSVFTMMTCYNGFFQDAYNDSLSEALLKSPGGAVAVWASSTLTEPTGQNAIDREFYRLLFGAQPVTLGDAARAAKTATGDADVRRTWTLFGDPALRLR